MSILQPINITVDAVIFSKENQELNLLLIKRKNEPFKNHWALPGGFVNADELVVKACQRELKEETHLDLNSDQMKFLGYYDKQDRDPRSRTITFAFLAVIDYKIKVEADDDAGEARWFNFQDLPELAFDHYEIIEDALKFK